MSEELYNFYCSYKLWLDVGAPTNTSFSRHHGLCGALRDYLIMTNIESRDEIFWKLYKEMENQFIAAGLDCQYPFNLGTGLMGDYDEEAGDGLIHTNPARIAWVTKQVNSGECYVKNS